MSPSKKLISSTFSRARSFVGENLGVVSVFWLVLVLADISNYFLQTSLSAGDIEQGRVFEIFFQLFILFFSVVFIHFVSNRYHRREVSLLRLIGESLILSPGYLLQTILFCLSLGFGLALLILPGIYVGLTFFFAPILSVLFPSYSGKTFLLSRELFKDKLASSFAIVLLTAVVPFIPDGIGIALTGELKSIWSLWLSPFDSLFFILSEVLVVFYVLEVLETQFPSDFSGAKISS